MLAKRLPLPKLRLGYHQLRILRMQDASLATLAEAGFIVCPARTKSVGRRTAGFGLSLYGVRSARNWGCGDFTDLRVITDALAPAGAAFIGLNPLHAIANRQPYNTSPYLPECSLYRNFIYLDVERVGAAASNKNAAIEEITGEMREEDCRAPWQWNSSNMKGSRILKLAALSEIFKSFASSDEFRAIYRRARPTAIRLRRLLCSVRRDAPPLSRKMAVDGMARRISRPSLRVPSRRSRRSVGIACASYSTCNGSSACRPPTRRPMRKLRAWRSASITIWLWPRIVTERICGPTGLSMPWAAVSARRPTIWRRRARTGAFRPPIAMRIAATGIICSAGPSGKPRKRAAHCASIT